MGKAFFVRSRVELLIKKLSTRMESQSYKKNLQSSESQTGHHPL